jgi:adenylate cyclase class 2
MLEVEMKFPVPDLDALARRLTERGARAAGSITEEDHYVNAPDRDFAQTDEALRLRRVGTANFVTYKGPKLDKQTKTRTEIEVPLAEGDEVAANFLQLLNHLGYRFVAVVRKQRRLFRLEQGSFAVEACLDEVEGVGTFAELEICAPDEKLDAARDVLFKLAGELGLSGSERRSYLEMWLESKRSASGVA